MAGNPVDTYVGSRVKLRRTLIGMSQEKLGTALGLTFQQVQKYERGANRIGASRLYRIAQVLDVPIGYFFDGYDETQPAPGTSALAEEAEMFEHDHLARRETIDMIRAYYSITDASVRRRMIDLVRSVGAAMGAPPK